MTPDTLFAYQDLRSVCSDLLVSRDRSARRQLLAALRRHLQSRCLRCGALLTTAAERADPREDLCYPCQRELIPPPPEGYPGRPDDEVPF